MVHCAVRIDLAASFERPGRDACGSDLPNFARKFRSRDRRIFASQPRAIVLKSPHRENALPPLSARLPAAGLGQAGVNGQAFSPWNVLDSVA